MNVTDQENAASVTGVEKAITSQVMELVEERRQIVQHVVVVEHALAVEAAEQKDVLFAEELDLYTEEAEEAGMIITLTTRLQKTKG